MQEGFSDVGRSDVESFDLDQVYEDWSLIQRAFEESLEKTSSTSFRKGKPFAHQKKVLNEFIFQQKIPPIWNFF